LHHKRSHCLPLDNKGTAGSIYLPQYCQEDVLETIVIVVLVLLLLGSLPIFPYSRSWGYAGSGTLGTILAIVVVLFLLKII
jgi:hypothetical protein